MAVVESGNCEVGVDLGRGTTPPSPLDDHPSPDSADELPAHRQGGIIRLPEPTTTLARSMDPAQVEGARRAFFSNFVQNKGGLQQVQLQHGDRDLRLVGSGNDGRVHGDGGGGVREIRQLQELFMKLNPMAKEFVPPSHANGTRGIGLMGRIDGNDIGNGNGFLSLNGGGSGPINSAALRRKQNQAQGRRRLNSRTSQAQRDEIIRRTIYVSDIDHQVTEEQLASLFVGCGQVVDCRICGDPNSVLRFAFIEFTDEDGARTALNLSGTMLGFYPVRVLPSKTAIAPVNPTFLPRNEDEREMCTRTIYCTNIDKEVTQSDVKLFFESVCGEVYQLRLLGDHHHSTRIAFVEFVMAESAIAALNCSGVVLGSLPIRVSPSKTPVRPRAPRLPGN